MVETGYKLNGAQPGDFRPVIQPQDHPNKGFSGGVGTPQVCVHPDGTQYLLFTGWTDKSNRHLYVAEIDGALSTSNYTQVLDASVYGKVEGAYAWYDKTNSEWVVGFTTPGSIGLHISAFSADWSTENYHQGYSQATKDSGATPLVTQDGALYLVAIDNARRDATLWPVQSDVTTRGFSTSLGSGHTLLADDNRHRISVLQADLTEAGLVLWYETRSNTQQWRVHPAFVGHIDGGIASHAGLASNKAFFGAGFSSGGGNFGHPHYTSQLGRPLVFFDWFRNLVASASGTYRHEIWATEPNYDVQKTEKWMPLQGRLRLDGSSNSAFINTHGASELVVQVDASGGFTLDMVEAMSGGHLNAGLTTTRQLLSPSGSGTYKATATDLAPCIRFITGSSVNSVDVMLR